MRKLLLLFIVCSTPAWADRGPRVCHELEDCTAKCKKGNGEACLLAGMKSDRGEDAGDDGSKARELYAKACKRKVARGCLMLGRSLLSRNDAKLQKQVNAAFKQAIALLDKQCKKQKDADACAQVAALYASGQGVPRDEKKAADYQQRSCRIRFNGPCPPPPPPPGRPEAPVDPGPAQ